jgi:hypothetical protein
MGNFVIKIKNARKLAYKSNQSEVLELSCAKRE